MPNGGGFVLGNPNVFVIGMLKKADPEYVTSRHQEVGRGLRLCVNQRGDRMDDPATVHDLNVLTVVEIGARLELHPFLPHATPIQPLAAQSVRHVRSVNAIMCLHGLLLSETSWA